MNGIYKRLSFLLALTASTLSALVSTSSLDKRASPWLTLPPTPALPGRPTGQKVLINGAQIWYAEFGSARSPKVPVLCLHGGFGNSDYYGSMIPLISSGRRVIVMDTRGHGRSTKDGQALTFELYASDAVGLLSHLRIAKAAFIGWSHMGVGTIAAMMNPRTASFVERAFLFGAYHHKDANHPTYASTPIYKEFVARAKSEYVKYQPRGDLAAFARAVGTLDSTLPLYTAADMAKITLGNKVTVAFGDHEEAIKLSELTELPRLIRGSRRVIVPGVSHFGLIQNPTALGREINTFLNAA